MTSFQLFKGMTNIDSELLESVTQQNFKKGTRLRKIWLIAAIITLTVLLVGCAAYAWHWYQTYFTIMRETPISDSQIDYIQENAQDIHESQTYDGYTVELLSTLSEKERAYLTFRITAPEDVDLSFAFGDENLMFDYAFAGPADAKIPAGGSHKFVEDGDGKKNTIHYVVEIDLAVSLFKEDGIDASFGPGHPWRIVLKNLTRIGYDREYEQELLRTKYAGQEAYMMESDEVERMHPRTLLAEGRWEFVVELDAADLETLELLQSPIVTKAIITRKEHSDTIFYDTADAIEEITITSVQLHSLGATVTFIPPGEKENSKFPEFFSAWLDMGDTFNPLTKLVTGDENFFLLLKDGTRIDFWQTVGATETANLASDSPIVLEDVDYLQLSDGTKLYPVVK